MALPLRRCRYCLALYEPSGLIARFMSYRHPLIDTLSPIRYDLCVWSTTTFFDHGGGVFLEVSYLAKE